MNTEMLQAKLESEREYAVSSRRNTNVNKAYARGYLGMSNTAPVEDKPFDELADPTLHYLDGVIEYLVDEALILHEERCDAADRRADESWYRPGGPADMLSALTMERL